MENNAPEYTGLSCPLPLPHGEQIVLGHGSGGQLSHDLINRLFLPAFANPALLAGDDAAALALPGGRVAVSTDSHVVTPLFFPGGDIGRLAVCGTVNDVAMLGGSPRYLTAGFILEEGLEVEILRRVIASMQAAAIEAGVQLVAGDTKVVQRGKADGLYINTTGIGLIPPGVTISGMCAQPGDVVLLSGSLGEHGIAVLAARGELGLETTVCSDIAPLNRLVAAMLAAVGVTAAGYPEALPTFPIHVLRDPTRGGLATSLNEIARQSNIGIQLYEEKIPVRPEVAAACELLGFDPLYIANEGKLLAIVAPQEAEAILLAMRNLPEGQGAVAVGQVLSSPPGRVLLKTTLGSTRVVPSLAGELLPRIC